MKQMLAIIGWELRQRRMALVWWSIGIAALISIDMLLYAAVKDQAEELKRATEHVPPALKALVSGGTDFLSPVGFLSARIYYLLLPLLLIIFTIGLGAGLIGKDENRGTLELLLARPISRTKILFSKLLAGVIAVAILAIVALLTALLCLEPSGLTGITPVAIARTTLHAVLLSSIFGMTAFMLAACRRPFRSAAAGIAALVAFSSYLLASLEGLASWLEVPAKLLPYHYYRPSDILSGASPQHSELLGFTVSIAVLALVAWFGFRRRDIQ